MVEGSIDTSVIIACFDHLSDQLDKRASVLIDNAPMPRSQEFIDQMPKWVKKGLMVK
jgi:hypothetical protein